MPDEQVLLSGYKVSAWRQAKVKDRNASLADNIGKIEFYFNLSRQLSDQSFAGFALAMIGELPTAQQADLQVQLLKADLLGYSHEFKLAEEVLEDLLPSQIGAVAGLRLLPHYMRAGRFSEAKSLCANLDFGLNPLIPVICLAWTDGVTESLEKSVSRLKSLEALIRKDESIHQWLVEIQVDLLFQLNQPGQAIELLEGARESSVYSHLLRMAADYAMLSNFPPASKKWIGAELSETSPLRRLVLGASNFSFDELDRLKVEELVETWRLANRQDKYFDIAVWYAVVEQDVDLACRYARLNWGHQQYVPDALLLKRCSDLSSKKSINLTHWVENNAIQSVLFQVGL